MTQNHRVIAIPARWDITIRLTAVPDQGKDWTPSIQSCRGTDPRPFVVSPPQASFIQPPGEPHDRHGRYSGYDLAITILAPFEPLRNNRVTVITGIVVLLLAAILSSWLGPFHPQPAF